MAKINDRRCHIAFLDSRGTGLQNIVDRINGNEYLEIRISKGASLHHLSRKASAHLVKYPFDVIYIAGGACDITTKNYETNVISFLWDPPSKVESHLTEVLDLEDKYMSEAHPAAKVIFCPLVGIDLSRAVSIQLINKHQQEAVNNAIFNFNTQTFKINKRRGNFSPALHNSIHKSIRGTKRSYYDHLQDGVHPDEELREKWAHDLVKAVGLN